MKKSFFISLIILLAFMIAFIGKTYAQRNLSLHNVKIISLGSGDGNLVFLAETQAGKRFYFWTKNTDKARKLLSDAHTSPSDQYSVYYYNDLNKFLFGDTWMNAFGLGYMDQQFYLETGRRVR